MHVILNDELYHHGIKGQRWGVRRFQNADGSLKPAGEKRYGGSNGESDGGDPEDKEQSSYETKERIKKHPIKNIKEKFDNLDPRVKKALKVAAVTTVVLASVKVAADIHVDKIVSDERKRNISENVNFSDIKKVMPSANKRQDMSRINPDYDVFNRGTTRNCTLCTTAYELRRRGYDVEANYSNIGREIKDVSKFFKNTTKRDWVTASGEKGIMKALDKMPEGSRGNICAWVAESLYGPRTRHSMVWEKEGGKITIRDCQTDTVYKHDGLFVTDNPFRPKGIILAKKAVQILRTDNREINTSTIMDAIKPARQNRSLSLKEMLDTLS